MDEKLNNLDYITNKIKLLVLARRVASPDTQKRINTQLDYLYNQKYKILKGEVKEC